MCEEEPVKPSAPILLQLHEEGRSPDQESEAAFEWFHKASQLHPDSPITGLRLEELRTRSFAKILAGRRHQEHLIAPTRSRDGAVATIFLSCVKLLGRSCAKTCRLSLKSPASSSIRS